MTMEKKQYIIIGEAPESDSEEEVNVNSSHCKRNSDTSNPQGIVIAGEAPESDDEEKTSVHSISSSSSFSPTSVVSLSFSLKKSISSDKSKKQDNVKYTSLLHRKLRERNMSLHKNVVEFIHHNVGLATRDLHAANQQLLKSQVQLQEVALSLHSLHTNLSQLQSKLAAATSSAYLSRINLNRQMYQ